MYVFGSHTELCIYVYTGESVLSKANTYLTLPDLMSQKDANLRAIGCVIKQFSSETLDMYSKFGAFLM